MLQEHLITFHKISPEAAQGIVLRRNLVERIIATRGPILCQTCSHPVVQEELMQPFHQVPSGEGFQFVLVINVLVLSDFGDSSSKCFKRDNHAQEMQS